MKNNLTSDEKLFIQFRKKKKTDATNFSMIKHRSTFVMRQTELGEIINRSIIRGDLSYRIIIAASCNEPIAWTVDGNRR